MAERCCNKKDIRFEHCGICHRRLSIPESGQFDKSLQHHIEATAKGGLFGEWNDYGRLSECDWEG